jgi:hypothetical protein
MKVNAPTMSMNIQAPSQGLGVQGAGATSFQARLAAGAGGSPSAAGVDPTGAEILQHATQEIRGLLRLQYELSRSTNSLISNLMKARHETAKNAIQNIR